VIPELKVAVPLVIVVPLLTTLALLVTPELLVTDPLVVVDPLVVRFCVVTSPRVRLCHERDEMSEAVTPVFVEMLDAIAESRLVTAATPLTVLMRSDPLVESA
jgi:hypothetical protein